VAATRGEKRRPPKSVSLVPLPFGQLLKLFSVNDFILFYFIIIIFVFKISCSQYRNFLYILKPCCYQLVYMVILLIPSLHGKVFGSAEISRKKLFLFLK